MKEPGLERVAVIGAGLMGAGIALEFARFGCKVNIYNRSAETSKHSMQRIREDLDLMAESGLITAKDVTASLGRIHPATDLKDAAAGAEYVVESVAEVLPIKQEVFARLDEICTPPVILATNTSTLRVTKVAETSKHPERIVAAHYFQPPHLIPLVEVCGGEKTERWAIDRTAAILRGLRKRVAVIDMELPGIIGNRLQGAMAREIRALVDRGAASPTLIDDIISFGFGRRLPYTAHFKRMDLVGLDLEYTIDKGRGVEPWKPVAERVERGDLGMKSGRGFYEWSADSARQLQRRRDLDLIRLLKQDMEDGSI